MNLGELKAFIGDGPQQSKAERPDQAIQKQLREAGLRQAYNGLTPSVGASTSQISSQTSVGLRVYNQSLNQNLTINEHKAKLPLPTAEEGAKEKQKSLFDFEEVAKNVLHFVGGAIKHAKAKGLDDTALVSMFEQARTGVLKGIDMAKKDLGGMMNDEISTGIVRSKELIDDGIKKLEDQMFGRPEVKKPSENILAVSESVVYAKQGSGDIQISTQDGDEVRISFESAQQFKLNQSLLLSVERPVSQSKPEPSPGPKLDGKSGDESNVRANSIDGPQEEKNVAAESAANEEGKGVLQQTPVTTVEVTQSYSHFEKAGLSFSLRGELDDKELAAIGELVSNANKLADEFFNGDVESAFQQALDLGFDEKELTGFALQLSRNEQAQVIQTYESVSHFKDDQQATDPTKAAKPVAQYLDHMLEVMEQSRLTLQNKDAYENLVNGLINQMGEVHTPDLVHAINRFHAFNQKLIDNLPESFKRDN
jgi:hypothetical protein